MSHDVESVRLTMSDVMASGHCASGTRRWFNDHGLDFKDFMKNGIPASQLLALNDGLGNRVVEDKLKRLSNG